jgi:hypothetical protein
MTIEDMFLYANLLRHLNKMADKDISRAKKAFVDLIRLTLV